MSYVNIEVHLDEIISQIDAEDIVQCLDEGDILDAMGLDAVFAHYSNEEILDGISIEKIKKYVADCEQLKKPAEGENQND